MFQCPKCEKKFKILLVSGCTNCDVSAKNLIDLSVQAPSTTSQQPVASSQQSSGAPSTPIRANIFTPPDWCPHCDQQKHDLQEWSMGRNDVLMLLWIYRKLYNDGYTDFIQPVDGDRKKTGELLSAPKLKHRGPDHTVWKLNGIFLPRSVVRFPAYFGLLENNGKYSKDSGYRVNKETRQFLDDTRPSSRCAWFRSGYCRKEDTGDDVWFHDFFSNPDEPGRLVSVEEFHE